jgi:hypothetical protein
MTDQFGNPMGYQPELFNLGEQRKSAHQRRDSSGKRSNQSPVGRISNGHTANPAGFNLMGNRGNDVTYMSPNTRAKGMGHQLYSVTFKIKYETKPGEDLWVVGDCDELGQNKDLKHGLKWTAGHIWVSEAPLTTSKPFF